MTINALHRTWALGFAFLLLLIQTPTWAHIPQGVGMLILFGVCIQAIFQNGDGRFTIHFLSVGAIGLCGYLSMSLFWSEIPSASLQWYGTYMIVPVIVLTAAFSPVKLLDIRAFLRFCWWIGFAICGYALYQFMSSGEASYPFYNPNSLAGFLSIFAILTVNYALRQADCRMQLLYALIFGFALIGILVTQSRGMMVIVPIATILTSLFYMRCVGFKPVRNVMVLLAVVYGLALSVPPLWDYLQPSNGVTNMAERVYPTAQSAGTRIPIWVGAIEAATHTHPLVGNGIGTFQDIHIGYRHRDDLSTRLHAHNDILHLWVEIGAIGLVILSLMGIGVIQAAGRIWRVKNTEALMPLSIVVTLGGVALMTPVILLPIILLVGGVAITGLMACLLPRHNVSSTIFFNGILLFLIVVTMQTIQNMAHDHYLYETRAAIAKGDLQGFVNSADRVDIASLGLDPAIPTLRAATTLAMIEQNLIPAGKKQQALADIEAYIEEAKHKNSYLSELYLYEGHLYWLRGDKNKAIEIWKAGLAYDPIYLALRLKLMSVEKDPHRLMNMVREGMRYRYWRQNSLPFYKTAMAIAKSQNDPDLFNLIKARFTRAVNG